MSYYFIPKYLLVLSLLLLHLPAMAQPAQGLIYGEIVLKNGTQYKGQIRWDNEEAFWNDVFDAPKYDLSTQNLHTMAKPRQVEDRSNDFKLGFMELWADKIPNTSFPFRCNFGDLVSLKAIQDDAVLLSLKNGDTVKLKSGRGGDLSDKILIFDHKIGKLTLNFKDISAINFKPTPPNFRSAVGAPIYAKILTTMGVFEGYITWDLEECLGKDLISGKQKGVKVDIEFEDIANLKAQHDGSMIRLKSGQNIFLNDHDDVSQGNHGIMIRSLSFGKLIVRWENFISATFIQPPVNTQLYDDFRPPQLLRGTISTKSGSNYQGQIIYDLDEIYDIEFLNGENNGFEYYVTFRELAKIEPQNDKFSLAYTKDNRQFLLGGNGDVTANNHGLAVQLTEEQVKYIAWKDIKSIEFE